MPRNLAIVGCGYWSNNINRVFSELRDEKKFDGSIVLYDINSKASKELSERYGFDVKDSYESILNDKTITAVLIITPTGTHYELAKKALQAGKNLFVEKPFTLSSKQAKELIHLAEEKDLILMVGHIFRYHQGLLELKRRMELGEFGKILFMMGYKFGYNVPKEDAGVIITLAVNDFDIFCFLMNVDYPETILAHRGAFLQKNIEEIASISLTFPNGVQGYFVESWLMPVFERTRELIVVGSNKTARIDYLKPNEIIIYDVKIKKEEVDARMVFRMEKNYPQRAVFEFKEPLKEEMMHLLKCLEEHKKPDSNGKVGYKSIRMCEMALKSADLGKKIATSDELKLKID